MHISRTIGTVCLMLSGSSAAAHEICGVRPTFSDPTISREIVETVGLFRVWSGSGDSFARFAAGQYRLLAERHGALKARRIAVALLHAECTELTRGRDPARLPWHFKDRLMGLSKIVPDFREAEALLARIKSAEARR